MIDFVAEWLLAPFIVLLMLVMLLLFVALGWNAAGWPGGTVQDLKTGESWQCEKIHHADRGLRCDLADGSEVMVVGSYTFDPKP